MRAFFIFMFLLLAAAAGCWWVADEPQQKMLANRPKEPERSLANANWEEALRSLDRLNHQSRDSSENCDCDTEQFPPHWFAPEEVNKCSLARRMFQREISRFPNQLRQTREHGVVPPSCVSFIMHRFGPSSRRSSLFAHCQNSQSAPVRSAYKPCVSADYVNVTTNILNDLSVCMGVNPKLLLPKLAQESGLHWNAFGASGDAGIGQLTGPAIKEVNRHFSFYKNHVLHSPLASCRNMADLVASFQPQSASLSHRCAFLWPPQNPALNIFYLTIKVQKDLEYLNHMLNRQRIAQRIQRLSGSQVSWTQITELMTLLAYNAGAGGAVSSLQSYLDYREQRQEKMGPPLRLEDFAVGFEQKNAHSQVMSFPEYLKRYQRVGTKGYLSKLRQQADLLDQAFPNHQCTLPHFLRLR